MTTPTPAPLGIGVFGLDDRARNILILFFAGPCKGCFALVDWADAEIRIVDLDEPDGADHFKEQAATNSKQPIVGISTHAEKAIDVPYFIKKPMRLDTVWSVLMQAGGKIRRPTTIAAEPQIPKSSRRKALPKTASKVPPRAAGAVDSGNRACSFAEQRSTNTAATADAFEQDGFNRFLNRVPDVNLSRTEATPKLFYDPEGCMQWHFRNAAQMAREQNTPVRLKGLWGSIYVLPAENRAYSGVPDVRLHGLTAMRMPSSGVVIAPIGSAEAKSQIAELDSVAISSIDALMWKLALWTSRGRLPAGTDLKAPVFLKRWPNFTRFVETPRAMRIAALWARQPCTLDETPEALGIRQAEVFAFYSAAIALRCAEIGRRQADTLISPIPVQPASERGLFKRILNRLFGQAVVAPKSSMNPSHHDALRHGQGRARSIMPQKQRIVA